MAFAVPARVQMTGAAGLLAAGRTAVAAGESEIDLAAAVEYDSSLVACLIDWSRAAGARGARLMVSNAPPGLRQIAALYGVEGLLFA